MNGNYKQTSRHCGFNNYKDSQPDNHNAFSTVNGNGWSWKQGYAHKL